MILIPVIDLMHGQVVRAQRGERSRYQPIVSSLCGSAVPVEVARTLVDHCAADQLYIADLDALQGGAVQVEALRAIRRALPEIELWVDAGFTDAASAAALRAQFGADPARLRPVFGSESLRSRADLEGCFGASSQANPQAGPQALLSLDRRDGRRLDAAGCWDTPALWPGQVIVMTLERVGADAGPDLETLREVQSRAPATALVGAGGIRDAADLARAAAAGAWGWLVASALHDGRLPRVPR